MEKPTRGSNILDLLFTNDSSILLNIEVDDTVISDHRLLIAKTILAQPKMLEKDRPKLEGLFSLNFHDKSIDWKQLNCALMGIDWDREFCDAGMNEIYDVLMRTWQVIAI